MLDGQQFIMHHVKATQTYIVEVLVNNGAYINFVTTEVV